MRQLRTKEYQRTTILESECSQVYCCFIQQASTPSMMRTTGSISSGDLRDENYWRKKFDDNVNLWRMKKKQLLHLKDKLTELNEAKFTGQDDSPLTRSIRVLENRLDKVMIKYNEAQSIRKTYEQIVKRLKDERVGYDNQLAAIERSLKGKEHDYEELLLLAHDATHAKELAQAELKKYEHKKAAVRELRKTYLEEKKKAIEAREDVIQKIDKKDKDNNDKLNELKTASQYNVDSAQGQNDGGQVVDSNTTKQKLSDYEEAFRRINEATGVTDVNEIIQKFTTQDETTKSLNDLKHEYIEKIEYLTNEKQMIKQLLDDLKYSGGENMTRKQLDEIENNVNNATNKCERARLKYERISKILVNAKAGVEHLSERLEFFPLVGKPNLTVTDETLVECLAQCVEKLRLIYSVVKNDPQFVNDEYKRASQRTLGMSTLNNVNTSLLMLDKTSKIEGLARNIRVRPPEKDEDDVSDGEIDDDIDVEVAAKLKAKYEMQLKHEKVKQTKTKKGKDSGGSFRAKSSGNYQSKGHHSHFLNTMI
eukprot:TRINITY_DN12332_c0_g1_i1.p1 TRINITY_DN12332_c0_g1~~TRINITY_DN12332_c0_g1_i1.p1  ORF type:complete len:536 (+),score=134.05 TRINITY_DN12332_c0_g1_i1:290-1897(+)